MGAGNNDEQYLFRIYGIINDRQMWEILTKRNFKRDER